MARKVINYTVESTEDDNRDKGKVFQITEMSAAQAERWAFRALQAMERAGVNVPTAISMGWQGIAAAGLSAFAALPFSEAEVLLNEMMECVRIKPDPRNPSVVRDMLDDDIEEVDTRFKLRMEIFKLHSGFLRAVGH